ncbi:unnamed protein product [Porites lobata]|uniref:Uncharacterized protein n=1 Tax=Porites lobata TaxID=104759 RepID=A0ABN8MVU1_9CNID|nr:unnamed protein product [Porites lobata]
MQSRERRIIWDRRQAADAQLARYYCSTQSYTEVAHIDIAGPEQKLIPSAIFYVHARNWHKNQRREMTKWLGQSIGSWLKSANLSGMTTFWKEFSVRTCNELRPGDRIGGSIDRGAVKL